MNSDSKTGDRALFLQTDDLLSDGGHIAPASSGMRAPVARKPRKVVTTLTLSSRTCRWPIGDPATVEFHYCGVPPQSGRPYCDEHDRMSYQAVPRKRTPAPVR